MGADRPVQALDLEAQMTLERYLHNTLTDLAHAGLLRSPVAAEGPVGPTLRIEGQDVICLCSNNYLGLATHPELVKAMQKGVANLGVGSGASRLVSGTLEVHRRAEKAFADFVGMEDAIFFSSGYAANLGVISALMTEDDIVFSDRLNHASIIDGCRISRAMVRVYHHLDTRNLAFQMEQYRSQGRNALVVTDGVFSMDGDAAPLQELRELCNRYDAALMVDEAHALGIFGPRGAGVCARAGIKADILLGPLGKSFGLSGAFAAGSAELVRFLVNRARSFVYSTSVPPYLAESAIVAKTLVEQADNERTQLLRHTRRLRQALSELGYEVGQGESPIIPIFVRDPVRTMKLSVQLLQRGVFVQGIRPPSVPSGTSRLRAVPIASHTDAQIEHAIATFAELAD